MPRFFVDKNSIEENTARITGKDAYHIARSLRMAEGDEVYISDGEGTEYPAILTRIRDDECILELGEGSKSDKEPKMNITLFMAYPKGDKLETVIQKAVELGATRIVPFESKRCIKRPKAEKIEKQTERLSKIAAEAAKQCGRAIIPEVSRPLSFGEMLSEAKESELALICYERESHGSVKEILSGTVPRSIAVIVGSEGGFDPKEVEDAIAAGCRSVTLGHRILRCETAPSAILSMILYRYEL